MSLGITAHRGGKTEARLQVMWLPAEGETPRMCEYAFFRLLFYQNVVVSFSLVPCLKIKKSSKTKQQA